MELTSLSAALHPPLLPLYTTTSFDSLTFLPPTPPSSTHTQSTCERIEWVPHCVAIPDPRNDWQILPVSLPLLRLQRHSVFRWLFYVAPSDVGISLYFDLSCFSWIHQYFIWRVLLSWFMLIYWGSSSSWWQLVLFFPSPSIMHIQHHLC